MKGIQTHGPRVTHIALCLTLLTPLIGLIIALLGAWFSGQLSG
jgi:hypothetical protein